MEDIALLPVVKRWWWALALGALVAGVAAYVVSSHASPSYVAETKLLVGPVNTDYGTLRASSELGRTYADLATSDPLVTAATRQARVRLPLEDARKAIEATSNQVTRVVTISVELPSASAAARLANAIGRGLTMLSKQTPQVDSDTQARIMEQDALKSLPTGDQERVGAAISGALGPSAAGRLEVVDPADPPTAPDAPVIPLLSILAALAGMLVAGMLVLFKESAAEATADERSLGAVSSPSTFLGVVDAPRRRDPEKALAVDVSPHSVPAERYRVLAAKLNILKPRSEPRSFVVLDAGDGSTAGAVAANLAAVLAEADWRVLLIDANAGKDGVTSVLGLDGRPGYSELLAEIDDGELGAKIRQLRVQRRDDLTIVPRGMAATPGLLDAERAERLLATCHQDADAVVVSAPPIQRSPAALTWARTCDGTVLVADEGHTRHDSLEEAVKSLHFVDARVIGTVLTRRGRLRVPFLAREERRAA